MCLGKWFGWCFNILCIVFVWQNVFFPIFVEQDWILNFLFEKYGICFNTRFREVLMFYYLDAWNNFLFTRAWNFETWHDESSGPFLEQPQHEQQESTRLAKMKRTLQDDVRLHLKLLKFYCRMILLAVFEVITSCFHVLKEEDSPILRTAHWWYLSESCHIFNSVGVHSCQI